ncbi:hypothetical protein [Clostridium sp. CX1]
MSNFSNIFNLNNVRKNRGATITMAYTLKNGYLYLL